MGSAWLSSKGKADSTLFSKIQDTLRGPSSRLVRAVQHQPPPPPPPQTTKKKKMAGDFVAAMLRQRSAAPPLLEPRSDQTSARVVGAAIAGNVLVLLAKTAAAVYTSSGVLFAEALHSAADVVNQSLLMVGIQRAQRRGDAAHPYGYGPLKPAFALISATGVFFLGCGVSVYHGIGQLYAGNAELSHLPVGLAVVTFSLAVESVTCYYAWRKVRELGAREGGLSVLRYVREGRDTCAVAVLVEDAVAVSGALLAAACLAATQLTGQPLFDAAGTLLIGAGMGGLALFLISRNLHSLLGHPLDPRSSAAIAGVLHAHGAVKAVHDVKTITYGPNTGRFKAEIEYDGRHIAAQYLAAADQPPPLLHQHLAQCACAQLTPPEKHELMLQFGARIVNELAVEVDRVETDIISKTGDEVVFVDLESHAATQITGDDPILTQSIIAKLKINH